MPDDYRRRQTLKNAERYITPELKTFEDKALSAQERALAREKLLYETLLARARAGDPGAAATSAAALAALDVLATFAERARGARPRAPDVRRRRPASRSAAAATRSSSGRSTTFIANDLALRPERRLLIVTGPNMGGKSTYMRQAAVIALLAYCGSFVPAARARRSARSTRSTRASAPPTTSPADARRSWSR